MCFYLVIFNILILGPTTELVGLLINRLDRVTLSDILSASDGEPLKEDFTHGWLKSVGKIFMFVVSDKVLCHRLIEIWSRFVAIKYTS